MHILCIGAGFIGGPSVEELIRRGHDVAVFHRGSQPVPAGAQSIFGVRSSLRAHRAAFREFAPDVVIDTILSSERQAVETLEACRGIARRIVALSSGDVYRAAGILHGTEPGEADNAVIVEDSPLRTNLRLYPPEAIRALQPLYSWLDADYDKIPVERVVMGDREIGGTVLRLPMVYGTGDGLHRLHPILKRIDDGRRTIPLAASTAQWRGPRSYVENVAIAIALAAVNESAAGRIYNVCEPETYTELEWTQTVARVVGWDGDVVVLPDDLAPAHLKPEGNLRQHWVMDSTRIRTELGYSEAVPMVEALLRTTEWERGNRPTEIDSEIDYAAEDAAVIAMRNRGP